VFELSGKKVLVTGASSGLGAHFAKLLAAQGAEVIIAARRVQALDRLAGEIAAAGGTVEAAALDIADPASIAALEERLAGLDVLINNAGIGRPGRSLEQSEADWDAVMNTNLKGMFLMSQLAGRIMRDGKRGGSIVNNASILGIRQTPGTLAYTVSKAGVIQMTKTMALELARYDIRVNALAPGYFETEPTQGYFDTDAGRALIARTPMRRVGALEDLDGPLLLLASDASRFMTGAVIVVDGGHICGAV
jgi:NAD(P)-dependent dehydrogenase (short-subunit alcohol dehydrogenase family)